ncbi:hypothetical protein PC129_g10635 [Phytophthora cactorum]|uniref:RxLR effector protein n=1 Tax=Phytophthora cactorum TaxID=29920 RepID=A0A329S1P1_9STRA|nr:hypothetical protein Pcac1_g20853 [Phytophthora cactorum]KAG2819310.1 hypothetical protein PC112_g12242 [Phytophthora cactorum]KAG2821290.1 hypothetical protein PC111_g11096 [Phytophthora cactorum]KAG2855101.1 hypothetical protein PC113_g12735 [Phytophthora cactorum]KAG2901016.1 hypothetical protein PC114_g13354 [Phytophthora cactorum]
MRVTSIIFFASASILASISGASTAPDAIQRHLSIKLLLDFVEGDEARRFLRRQKTNVEDEERGFLDQLAVKLDDVLTTLPKVQNKTKEQVFQLLQDSGLLWGKREVILHFVSLGPDDRKKVLGMIVKNAAMAKAMP